MNNEELRALEERLEFEDIELLGKRASARKRFEELQEQKRSLHSRGMSLAGVAQELQDAGLEDEANSAYEKAGGAYRQAAIESVDPESSQWESVPIVERRLWKPERKAEFFCKAGNAYKRAYLGEDAEEAYSLAAQAFLYRGMWDRAQRLFKDGKVAVKDAPEVLRRAKDRLVAKAANENYSQPKGEADCLQRIEQLLDFMPQA